MRDQLNEVIIRVTGARRIIDTHLIQNLWSYYCKIFSCRLEGAKMESVVVKHVQFPSVANHPRGWNTNRSDERKRQSYLVEIDWYSDLSRQCNDDCRVPFSYHCEKIGEEILMVLEDLNTSGFPLRRSSVSKDEILVCLSWLANFHALFMNVKKTNLWETGTYWHLATRADELAAMRDMDLQSAASKVDKTLNEANFQTLVHGDAKLANFCFSEDSRQVAAVDFQYVGHGCGMKDVAYFLSSCLNEDELFDYESEFINFYFDTLSNKLQKLGYGDQCREIRKEWTRLYPFAWTDFYRFLDGWSPGHWKMNGYSVAMKNKVLKLLN